MAVFHFMSNVQNKRQSATISFNLKNAKPCFKQACREKGLSVASCHPRSSVLLQEESKKIHSHFHPRPPKRNQKMLIRLSLFTDLIIYVVEGCDGYVMKPHLFDNKIKFAFLCF